MVSSTRRLSVEDSETGRQYDSAGEAQVYCAGALYRWLRIKIHQIQGGATWGGYAGIRTHCEFAVEACPKVQTIFTNGWRWLHSERGHPSYETVHTRNHIKATRNALKPRHLERMERWAVSLAEGKLGLILLRSDHWNGYVQLCWNHCLTY